MELDQKEQFPPLKIIDISDFADEEVTLIADSSDNLITFKCFWPILLPILCLIGSVFLPDKYEYIRETQILTNKTGEVVHMIESLMVKISPTVRDIAVGLYFGSLKTDTVSIDGELNITLTRDGMLVHALNGTVKPQLLPVSGGVSSKVDLFYHDVIDFDAIKTSFTVQTKSTEGETFTIEWRLGNALRSVVIAICRIMFCAMIIPNFISLIMKLIGNHEQPISIEVKLTAFLLFTTILYLDPLDVVGMYNASQIDHARHVLLRDIFFASLILYSFAIFGYFSRDASDAYGISVGFPVLLGICVMCLFIAEDIILKQASHPLIVPGADVPSFDAISAIHMTVFGVFFIGLIIRVIMAYPSGRDSRLPRYIRYSVSVIVTLVAVGAVFLIDRFIHPLPDLDAVLMAIFTAFALTMNTLHSESDLESGDYLQQIGDAMEENALGADEDSDEIGKLVKKGEGLV